MNTRQVGDRADRSILLLGCAALMVLLACVLLGGTGYWLYRGAGDNGRAVEPTAVVQPPAVVTLRQEEALIVVQPTPTPRTIPTPVASLTPLLGEGVSPLDYLVPLDIVQRPKDADMQADLDRMWRLDMPPYDYYEVAVRLGDVQVNRSTDRPAPALLAVETFKLDESEVSAELAVITDNAYFWVEDGLAYNTQLLRNVTIRFESELYPRLIDLFGQEWRPGIDGDDRMHIVHLRSSDDFDEIGFFNSVNQYPIALDKTSNEREMIFLNMDQLELGSDLYFATLVHEVQHLIQWNMDRNESVWLNEGLSQLAEVYLGFDTSETIDYLDDPSVQLNSWRYDGIEIFKHYAASYLFLTYFWEQLGDEALRQLVQSQANGLASVRQVLADVAPSVTLEQFLTNWAVANLLNDKTVASEYGYDTFTIGFPDKEDRVEVFPYDRVKSLPQFGVHYIDVRRGGDFVVTFAGDTTATLLPTTPPVGKRAWFAPSKNDVAATLTRQFDLSAVSEAVMTYAVWFELEEEFDFAYVEISADNGQSWEILDPLSATQGVYGPAYSGFSIEQAGEGLNGWMIEAVDLSAYTGQSVLIRFEVLSDGAFSERGFAVTNIQIDEIGYASDVDRNANEWEARGFAPVGALLPQNWSVMAVEGVDVTPLPLDELNQGQWTISAEIGATLIIMPQTPFVEETASYWLRIERSD